MTKRNENTETERRCYRCQEVKPLDAQHFYREKSRAYGFGFVCKDCERVKARLKPSYRRKYNPTPEQKVIKNIWQRAYYKTDKGRAVALVKAYQRVDKQKGHECDIDQAFLRTLFSQPCSYCGDTQDPIGADRVDNAIGHTKANLIPCCGLCNLTRNSRFSHAEMKVLGKCIWKIKQQRRK